MALGLLPAGSAGFILSTSFGGKTEAGPPPQYVGKIAALSPEASYWGDFAQKVKNHIENRSRGRAKVIWYISGVMGDEPEVIEKIRGGKVNKRERIKVKP